VEEDEMGLQRAIGHAEIGRAELVSCSRCGRQTPEQSAAIVPGDALADSSEYSYLCADCQLALADGEQDLPTTLE
jgi:hypothetical protein